MREREREKERERKERMKNIVLPVLAKCPKQLARGDSKNLSGPPRDLDDHQKARKINILPSFYAQKTKQKDIYICIYMPHNILCA